MTLDDLPSLVARARSGDPEAFAKLVRRFQQMAHAYAYAILGDFDLAQDAAQEAFMQVHLKLGTLRNTEAFPGWFRRIVLGQCDRLLRSRRHPTVPLAVAAAVPGGEPGPREAAERREMEEGVMQAVRSLPEGQREATTLFYIDGYSQDEIADFLEVPVTTVKKRLYDSRRKLKERMMHMVETTLKNNALPENFAERILMFPFPPVEPPVEIVDCPGECRKVRCLDAQSFFVPLVEGGKCDWTFYDWPGGRLTGVYECHVIGAAKWGKGKILRIWVRFTDLKRNGQNDWSESHYLLEHDTYRRVQLTREKPGKVRVGDYVCPSTPNEPPFPRVPVKLAVGSRWEGGDSSKVVGVSRVTINGRSWKCLKVVTAGQNWKSPDGKPTVYAEWYVADTGRTVFFRRYNAHGWREPEKPASFESLAGNLEVQYGGITFRHYYDCLPDIVLTRS